MEKYLYYNQRYTKKWYRILVSRETDANVWIRHGSIETKISKKTYRTGSGWDATHYYEETPELVEKYERTRLNDMFHEKLGILKTCTDPVIMKQVIAIKLDRDANEH